MDWIKNLNSNKALQYLLGIGCILATSFTCYLFVDYIGYHVVALILLLAVSILAMFLDILPMIVTAVLSALVWNFLFIQPKETFSINTPQDALLFLMYFVIALINAVFTSKLRKVEEIARKRKEREKTLHLYNTLLNSLSHELKTPISTIIGSVDTLQENTKLSEDNILELYSEINIAGNRLHQQVSNLLNMSRLESDFISLQLDWYDINEIIQGVIQNNQMNSTNHILKYNYKDTLPLFKVDGALLEQIVQNIIHNALQYTPPGSEIQIEAWKVEDELKIEIIDNGPGFPEDKIALVFDKFYRLPNTATGGTGLGLSIAKGFVQAHNGTIFLENTQHGGAKFTLCIPALTTTINHYENE